MTKIRLYALGKSTTLESNKSHLCSTTKKFAITLRETQRLEAKLNEVIRAVNWLLSQT